MIKRLSHWLKSHLREKRILKNITKKTSTSPKVLISYTVFPFLVNKSSHTNYQESHAIVNIFAQLGYQVDVIHYTNTKRLKYRQYDVIFGFGEPYEGSFHDSSCNAKRIYYATGAHIFHQNQAEALRISEFNAKYGATLLPKRIVPWCWTLSTNFSDYLIVIGNNWTADTYRKYSNNPVFPLNATAMISNDASAITRDVETTRNHFLWFGSAGFIHKGLDLCLEYFSEHPHYTFHICGPHESDFFDLFQGLFQKPNIIYHGFVDVSSCKFIDIVSQCLFAILPTCSEGQSTALLTAMATGLIPVGTMETGIDLSGLGFQIEGLNSESIHKSLADISLVESTDLVSLSARSKNYVLCNHSIDSFRKNLRQYLDAMLLRH